MKNLLLALSVFLISTSSLLAQLPNGSTAPDWTLTDINGNSHHLYAYLDSGYTVFIDFSATWCPPCWSYHNSGALENLYNQYGPEGTNEVRVFFIEADAGTNLACLYGSTGCVGGTQGDWVTGTPYPIINSASLNTSYAVPWFPTIYAICNNYEITYMSQPSTAAAYAFHTNNCPAPAVNLDVSLVSVQDAACYDGLGSIDISVSGGSGNYTYSWDNGATTQDLSAVPTGSYSVFVTDATGNGNGSLGPITVGEATPIVLTPNNYQPVTCWNGGNDGAVFYSVEGGTPGYSFLWSNGQTTADLIGVWPGNYTLTVTDAAGCTVTEMAYFEDPIYPTVIIDGNIPLLNCLNSVVTLNATSSSQGADVSYEWTTSNGHIATGANTLTPTVDAVGTYTLTITNATSNCTSTGSIDVLGDVTVPDVNANFVMGEILSCAQSSLDIWGSSTTQNAIFSWTGPNGFTSTNAQIMVNTSGEYVLTVTDPASGCSASTSVTVMGDTTPPNVDANFVSGEILTCAQPSLDIQGSSTTQNAVFNWTGPNGFTSTNALITANTSGQYTLNVTDSSNGCTASTSLTVFEDFTTPDVSATFVSGQVISCSVSSVALQGSSTTQTVTYSWTGPNGFNSTNANITVNTPGTYTLEVTDLNNGCTASTSLTVTGDASIPNVDANFVSGEILTCAQPSLGIQGSSTTQNAAFNWTGPNGFTSTNALITVTISGTYVLTVTDPVSGCTASTSLTVLGDSTIPNVDANFVMGEILTCSVGSVDIQGSSTTSNVTYSWTGPNGYATTNALATANAPGVYTLMVTDPNNGCTASTSLTVMEDVLLPQNVIVTSGGPLTCHTPTVDLIATSTTPNAIYSWMTPEGNTITGFSISVSTPGLYVVTVTDPSNGCSVSETIVLTSDMITPNISISPANPMLSCETACVNISATSSANSVTYAWTGPNGFTATSSTISACVVGVYQVVVTDPFNGCQNEAEVTVESATDVTIACASTNVSAAGGSDGTATVTVTSGTAPFVVMLNGTTQNIATVGANTVFQGLTSGTYTPTVTDASGCSETCTTTISEPGCSLFLSETHQDESCAGLADGSIDITANGANGAVSYMWSHSATTEDLFNLGAGTYTVVASDNIGCQASLTVDISSSTVVNPTFAQVGPLCALDAPITLPNVSNEGIQGTWNPNPIMPSNGTQTATYTPDDGQCANATTMVISVITGVLPAFIQFGPYCSTDDIVNLPGTANNGIQGTWTPSTIDPSLGNQVVHWVPFPGQCGLSYEQNIVVNDCGCSNPTVADAGADVNICNSNTVTLNGSISGGASSATWSGGAGAFSSATDLNAVYTASEADIEAGSVVLTLTTNDPDGNGPCVVATSEVTITFSAVTANAGEYEAACQGDIIPLVGSPVGGVWSGAGITNGEFNTASSGFGTFEVIYSYTNFAGCTGTDSAEITVYAQPVVTATVSGELCCTNPMVEIMAQQTSCANATYMWSNGAETQNITVDGPGDYTVTVTCEIGCAAETTVTVVECDKVESIAVGIINASGETISDGGAEINSIVGGTAPYSVEWFFNGEMIGTVLNNVIPGEYKCVVTDSNGCTYEETIVVGFVTGITTPSWVAGLQIFPNPNTGTFYIELDHVRKVDVLILNNVGQAIFKQKGFPSGKMEINLPGISSGVYMLRLDSDIGSVYRKIIIE